MRFLRFIDNGRLGLAVSLAEDAPFTGLREDQPGFPGDLGPALLETQGLVVLAERLAQGSPVDPQAVQHLPPVAPTGRILCVGLNYRDHALETGQPIPTHVTVFTRFASSVVGHGAALVRPVASELFDYEGELVAVIGKRGRHIPVAAALQHVAGYSVFNDGSLRDFQLRSTQWTLGKNFDLSGSFGPYLVAASALAQGAKGLRLQTRLNGEVMQEAQTDNMIFDIASLVAQISEAITLEPGDAIVTGTPSGVAMLRNPPTWMKAGDVCEVEIEHIGLLRNLVVDEAASALTP